MSESRADSGFILVAVLWLLAALASLAAIFSVYTTKSASAARVPDDRLRAEAAIHSGVELAAYQSLSIPKKQRRTHGSFATKVGDSQISVRFISEAARIDLNLAPKELIGGLFVALGVDKDVAGQYAAAVVGWREKVAANAANGEAALYQQAGLAYLPRGAAFNDALELSLVRGLPAAVVARVLPFVTVYSGKPELDIIDAEPTAIAALPGVTPDIIDDVLKARAGGIEGPELMNRMGPARDSATIEANDAMRAHISVETRTGRRVQADVVYRLLDGKPSPFDILYWRDDFDGPM